jgi:hypothetical protein
MINRKDEVGSL